MRVFLVIISLLLAFNVNAQENDTKPTNVISGKVFKKSAKRIWQRVDAEHMNKDQPLETSEKWWFEKKAKSQNKTMSRKDKQRVAGIILFILAVFIILLLWNYSTGGKLFSRLKKNDRFAGDGNSDYDTDLMANAAETERLSFGDLSKIDNPREGLHTLLVQALVRAANQNDIPLRRSLTSREVLRRVPQSWQHRSVLQALINRAELVLFGGRDITKDDYATALQMARPIFPSNFTKGPS